MEPTAGVKIRVLICVSSQSFLSRCISPLPGLQNCMYYIPTEANYEGVTYISLCLSLFLFFSFFLSLSLQQTSILLAKCFYRELVLPKTCETLSEEELITEIASLLLLHTRQLKSNSHAITEVRPSEGENTAGKSAGGTVEEISQFRVATAVYPTVSMMNHACIPNIIPR